MRKQLLIVAFIGAALVTNAQVKVGDNPTTINSNSVLEMESTNKGMLLPRVLLSATTAFAPLTAHVEGMMVYNTATATDVTPGYYYNDGTKWIRISSASTAPAAITADNGLAKTADNIQLGGSIIKPTTISTDATNNLVIEANGIGGSLVEANQGLNVLATPMDGSANAVALRGRVSQTAGTVGQLRGVSGVSILTGGTVSGSSNGGYFNNQLNGGALGTSAVMSAVSGDVEASSGTANASNAMIGGRFNSALSGSVASGRAIGVLSTAGGSASANIGALSVINDPTLASTNMGVLGAAITGANNGAAIAAINPTKTASNFAIYSDGNVAMKNLPTTGSTALVGIDANGNLSTTAASPADLRAVGTRNHISQDAGVGSDGTSAGTGTDNFIVGTGAGNAMTSGIRNTFLGSTVGTLNTTGSKNTIVGMPAFTANTTGEENSGFGISTFRYNTTGNRNTAIGAYGLLLNSTGSDNTAVGRYALYENTTGNLNIGIGISAGLNISSSSNNIAIGNEAWVGNGALSNQISIGNLIYANGADGKTEFISTGNVGIGVKAPSNRLHVVATANPLRLEGLQAGAVGDQILSVDPIGVVRKIAAVGPSDLRLVGTRNHISQDAGVGSNGTSAGTGVDNIAIGDVSGNAMTTGERNVFMGSNAGTANTIGNRNTGIGMNALPSNTTGIENTGHGYSSLRFNSTGSRNTAVGVYSLQNSTNGENNTAVGERALYSNGNGSYNTALGQYALGGGPNGSYNIGIGAEVGINVGGSHNIIIGNNVSIQNTTGSYQLNIGNLIYGTGVDGTLATLSTGNVGIGKKDPKSKLAVVGLPEFDGNTAAKTGLLTDGDFYRTATGVVMVVY